VLTHEHSAENPSKSYSINLLPKTIEGSKYSHLLDTSHNFNNLATDPGHSDREQFDFGRAVDELFKNSQVKRAKG
jgi:hypothetical protein